MKEKKKISQEHPSLLCVEASEYSAAVAGLVHGLKAELKPGLSRAGQGSAPHQGHHWAGLAVRSSQNEQRYWCSAQFLIPRGLPDCTERPRMSRGFPTPKRGACLGGLLTLPVPSPGWGRRQTRESSSSLPGWWARRGENKPFVLSFWDHKYLCKGKMKGFFLGRS